MSQQPSCSAAADHPPAVAHVRIFATLGAGEPHAINDLCEPCVKSELAKHAKKLASGAVASIVVISLAAIEPEIVKALECSERYMGNVVEVVGG